MAGQVTAIEFGQKVLIDLGCQRQVNRKSFCRDITNITKRSNNPEMAKKGQKKQNEKEAIKKKSISIKPRLVVSEYAAKADNQIQPYFDNIRQQMSKCQINIPSNKTFRSLGIQLEINRLILAHGALMLKEQTLYLSFIYFLEFSAKSVLRSQADRLLAAITCLWMASKYQQIYPPYSHHILRFLHGRTVQELQNMEAQILITLDFNLVKTTPLSLLSLLCQDKTNVYCLSNYLLQSLYFKQDEMIIRQPVLAVLGAYKIANHIFKVSKKSRNVEKLNKFTQQELSECFKKLCLLMEADCVRSTALKKKFGDDRMFKVSKICLLPK